MVERLAVVLVTMVYFNVYARQKNLCRSCRVFAKAVSARRKKLRIMARKYKSNKCVICDYSKCPDALNFHHRDPKLKDFGLSVRGLTKSWKKSRKKLINAS